MRRRAPLPVIVVGLLAFACTLVMPEPADSGNAFKAKNSFGLSRSALFARWNELRGDGYELDAVERFVEGGAGAVTCSKEGLSTYAGTTLRYHGPLLVQPLFRERLERFEIVVAELAEQTYGRKPRSIRHYGAFSCRLSRNRAHRLSEHALANAIDVVGFDFGPASKSEPLRPELPEQLARPFRVRVARHWAPGKRATASDRMHSRFLRELTSRLESRRDIFRSLIGPSHPTHEDHFHFDVSPWRYVNL